jgi:hypothetical protein
VNSRPQQWSSVKFTKLHYSTRYLQNIQVATEKGSYTHINLVKNSLWNRPFWFVVLLIRGRIIVATHECRGLGPSFILGYACIATWSNTVYIGGTICLAVSLSN